ncbi:unnamed protein product [Arabis nemorensis]|uniref:RNase H type-1 domain-containing protein n=1 Tax=Arabis nemorensis TaxID=586526 RepID=A0A565C890_9BRAS|nr:unnamed protein product [Arabis nemorensis]
MSMNCGMGWSLLSHKDGSVFQSSAAKPSVSLALVAEAWAMKAGFIIALEMGCVDVTVRSDSHSLVMLLNSFVFFFLDFFRICTPHGQYDCRCSS